MLTFGGAVGDAGQCMARAPRVVEPAARRGADAKWVGDDLPYTALGARRVGHRHLLATQAPIGSGRTSPVAAWSSRLPIYVLPLFELPPLAQIAADRRPTTGVWIAARLIPEQDRVGTTSLPSIRRHGVHSCRADDDAPRHLVAEAKAVRTGWWLQPLLVDYALAMVAYTYNTFHPHATAQTWMIEAASALAGLPRLWRVEPVVGLRDLGANPARDVGVHLSLGDR